MIEEKLTDLLDRAAGQGEIRDGFTARIERRGRELRLRRRAAVGAALAVTALLAGVNLMPAHPTPTPTPAASTTTDPIVERFVRQVDRRQDVLLAASADGYDVVLLREKPGEVDSAAGSKAASIWLSPGERFHQLTNYVAYDSGCYADDPVCQEIGTGNGFFAAITLDSGPTLAITMAPPGATIAGFDFRNGPRLAVTSAVTRLDLGPSEAAAWDLRAVVRLADGREYRIPVPVGGVVAAQHAGVKPSPSTGR
jgi:hypothetical protein